MTDMQPSKARLWRETFVALYRNREIFLPWWGLFVLLRWAGDFVMMLVQADPPARAIAAGALAVLSLASVYCFAAVYLRQEPVSAPPAFGIGGFFYWFLRVIGKFLLVLLPFGALALVSLMFVVAGRAQGNGMPGLIGIAVAVAAVLVAVYISVRLMLVTPLAVNRMAPVLKTAWQLSRGNWWRLLGNALVVYLALLSALAIGLGVLWILFAILAHALGFLYLRVAGIALFEAVSFATVSLTATVYICAAGRVLYREHQL